MPHVGTDGSSPEQRGGFRKLHLAGEGGGAREACTEVPAPGMDRGGGSSGKDPLRAVRVLVLQAPPRQEPAWGGRSPSRPADPVDLSC